MYRIVLTLVLLSGSLALALDADALATRLERFALADHTEGHPAALVLRDLQTGKTFSFNAEACARRSSPCSTFKIFNSLVGIETGVVKPDTLLSWDGQQQHFKSWERDHTLVSAYHNSVVWYYQRLAKQVGQPKLQAFLDQTHYGNQQIGDDVSRFWLDDSLQISPQEQVEFLDRLYHDRLPFSKETINTVRTIMVDTTEAGTVLSGKTGSAWADNAYTQGWYVGHLAHGNSQLVFALRIEQVSGRDARGMLIRMFRALGLMPPQAQSPD